MLGELEEFCRQRQSMFYPKADLPVGDDVLRALGNITATEEHLAAAATACRHVFGEAPLCVRPLGEAGTFHLLYKATLRDGRGVIVRLNALGRQRDFLLHLDPWVTSLVRVVGLPAVAVHGFDVSRKLCGFDWEVLEEAPGRSLTSLDDDEPRLLPLLSELGRLVARLHSIRMEGFGFFDVRPLVTGQGTLRGGCPSWSNYILRRLEDHLRTCSAIGAVSPGEAVRIRGLFAVAADWLDDVEPSLLHGDLGGHNVFADGDAITALIDWEDCLSGDPLFDVAFWATFHPERRHAAFLNGYASQRPLPLDFERRFWLYFLRVALSKTVLRHRLGLKDRPGREPASRRIQKGLQHVEAALGRRLAA